MFVGTNGVFVVWSSLVWILLLSPSGGNCKEIHANRAAATGAVVSGSLIEANRPPQNLGRKLSVFFGCRWSFCIHCDHDKCRECLAGYEWDGNDCTRVSHKRKGGDEKESEKKIIDCSKSLQQVGEGKSDEYRDLDFKKCEKKRETAKQGAVEPNL